MNRRPSVVIKAGRLAGLLAGLLTCAAWLAGCGQKGPLTMPAPAAAPATASSAPLSK